MRTESIPRSGSDLCVVPGSRQSPRQSSCRKPYVAESQSEESMVGVVSSEEGVLNVLVIRVPDTLLVLSELPWDQVELASDPAIER